MSTTAAQESQTLSQDKFDETRQSISVPLSQILADEKFNCRGAISPSSVVELAEDIRKGKLMYPVIVRVNSSGELFNGRYKYALVAGFRRFTAFRVLGRDTIPCFVEADMTLLDARVKNLRENLFRENLNILQEAHALAHFKDIYSRKDIGAMFGQSRGWAEVRCCLLELPEDIQAQAGAGFLTHAEIKAVYGLPAAERHDAVKKIKERKENGQRAPLPKSSKRNPWVPKIRAVADIEELQEKFRNQYGSGKFSNLTPEFRFACRILGWAAGHVSDAELDQDILEIQKRAIPKESLPGLSGPDESGARS